MDSSLTAPDVAMTPAQFLAERVDAEIAWHDRQSSRSRRFFTILSGLVLVATASLTLLTRRTELADVAAVVNVVAILASGFVTLGQHQQRWVEYRAIAESLRSQRFLFLTRTGQYTGPNAFPAFVAQVEAVLGQGLGEWRQRAARVAAGGEARS